MGLGEISGCVADMGTAKRSWANLARVVGFQLRLGGEEKSLIIQY